MLKRTLVIAAAAGLVTTAAQAESWKRYGSARFDTEVDRQVESARFGGTVDRIRLTARGSGVICRRVVAVFGNNNRHEIFSGRIRRGRTRTVDLPGNERRVDRLVLVCRATERGRDHARVLIDARTEERRGRPHRRGDNWERLGAVSVSDHYHWETESLRYRGHVDRISLTAHRSGVVCRRVVAEFGNDRRSEIFSGRIRRGQSRVIDLPSNERRVDRLMLYCRATERGRDRARILIAGRIDDRRHGRRRGRAGWERLGAVVLDDRVDREVESVRGGTMDRLRFTPRRSGVICRRVVAVFGNGSRREIFAGRIRRNQRKVVDLPGNERQINRLVFRCRATHRGNDRARLLIDGRMNRRHRRRGGATVCCRKLFFEWTTSAEQCREINGRLLAPRYCS